MFYNTKIRPLFVMIYVLQHIFDRNIYFIDVSQKNRAFHCILVMLFCVFLSYNIHNRLFISENIS